MLSIYTSAFNIIERQYDVSFFLDKALQIGDEVVIAVNKSLDGTLDYIQLLTQNDNRVKVLDINIPYTDPLLDGKLKNAALQATSKESNKLQLDLDEYIPNRFKSILTNVETIVLGKFPAMMLPSIDLYKDANHCKSVNCKWYLHRPGLFRGPVNFAKLENGHVDISKSDTCELIDSDGNLVQTYHPIPSWYWLSSEDKLSVIYQNNIPFVVHMGYLDLNKRILRNQKFWKQHWSLEAGYDVDIPTDITSLENEMCFKHNLAI